MRTLLRNFSEEFVSALRALLQPLDEASDKLSWSAEGLPAREILPELREVRHQLGVLVDKVADQHAFVLIFGPLKSGKSTLMNALAAAYVSEVSSLPAYPCMVYVSHSPTRSFTITRYHGGSETLGDTASLQMHVQRGHTELVEALRRAEDEGRAAEFDPSSDFPQAIRRIDVRVPAGDLEASGAVLVDTPGLYSRMKFGYDRMTREFRNAAACAIFVVKSDNLFLEQVFAEFNDLLDLFSRIFLVVNVDTTKMDLGPGGELVPSLEAKDPVRVVQAFENFAMSAPLKRAADEGRLAIYPIDLLRAASQRLQAKAGRAAAAVDAEEPGLDRRGSFAAFQRDLAEYLNSTDYLVAFVNDSLRRAEMLTGELAELATRDEVARLRDRVTELSGSHDDSERRRGAAEALRAFDWESAFGGFEDRLAALFRDKVRTAEERTSAHLDRALERWFDTDASLQSLVEDELVPRFEAHQTELSRFLHDTLSQEAASSVGGLEVARDVRDRLELAGIDTATLAREALEGARGKSSATPIRSPFRVQDVPIRKKFFWDWVLFRSQSAMSRRLFGPSEHPSVRIAPQEKALRLGEPALAALTQAVDRYKGEYFPASGENVRKGFLASYSRRLSNALSRALEERAGVLKAESEALARELAEARGVLVQIDELGQRTTRARSELERLRKRHADGGGPDLQEVVLEPARAPEPVAEVAAETADEPREEPARD